MSLKKRFEKDENKDSALVKFWFTWADSDKPYTFYSRPEYDKRGFDYAVRRTIAYCINTWGNKIKDQRICVFDNRTGREEAVYIRGKKVAK
jgi:hypothetical protein